ncbi:ABC transporter permease [Nocardioides sp. Bht2]|uniref:ABC transporter permease n=1 Tax=Nocardioides sp. Bht2 TaxID=3392297 RepID=UPI0039B42AB6
MSAPNDLRPERSRTPRVVRQFVADPTAMVAFGFLILLILVALLTPWIAPHSPDTQHLDRALDGPNGTHWLGADQLGRDVLSRLMYAARLSLMAATVAVGIAVVIGVPIGVAGGYFGGWVDRIVVLIADSLMGFPYLILAIGVVGVLGPSLVNAMIAIGVVYVPRLIRVARSAVLAVRGDTYLEASRSIGATSASIIVRHVVPNVMPPVVVQISLMCGFAMLAEASLSFLGLGAQPPAASWGSMLSSSVRYMDRQPLLMIWPGLALVLTVLAINLVGDGLRDAFARRDKRSGS